MEKPTPDEGQLSLSGSRSLLKQLRPKGTSNALFQHSKGGKGDSSSEEEPVRLSEVISHDFTANCSSLHSLDIVVREYPASHAQGREGVGYTCGLRLYFQECHGSSTLSSGVWHTYSGFQVQVTKTVAGLVPTHDGVDVTEQKATTV